MKNLNMTRVIGAVIILIVIIWLVITGVSKWRAKETPALNGNSYYAVFLTNDQVYFGHLTNVDDRYLTLTSIYYLKAADSLQANSAASSTAATADQSKLTLIKLGNEIHGPKDNMQINRQNVLFYEELKDDSQVVKTINKTT